MDTRRFAPAGIALLAVVSPARGDIYLDQPHDFIERSPAERDTAVPFARTADDFMWAGGKSVIHFISVDFVVTFPNAPDAFRLEIHFGETPSIPSFQRDRIESIIDRGPWNGDPGLHLVTVTFDMNILLQDEGRYWVVPYAIGNGSGTDRAWWGTAGNGGVNGSEGYFRSDHFGVPEWTPISQSGILDFPTDFAMTIDATIPAPGAIAMIGLGAGLTRKRRRRWV